MIKRLSDEQIATPAAQDSLLLRHFGGDSSKVAKVRTEMDRRGQTRLKLAIARGAELDHPTERVSAPAMKVAPTIDKAKLASYIDNRIDQAVRAEVGAMREEIMVKQSEAVAEIAAMMGDRGE